MSNIVTAMTLDIKSCNYRLSCEGFNFAYNTAEELAQLMYANCKNVRNPYDPDCTDYHDFNETIYKLQSNLAEDLALR